MLRWGRLLLLFSAIITAGTLVHMSDLSFDGPILVSVVASCVLGVIASIRTTRVYSARALGLIGTILGDVVIYSGFLVGIYELSAIEIPRVSVPLPAQDIIIDYGRGAFMVSAPLFAFGLLMAWWRDRRSRISYCGDDENCHRWWRERRKSRPTQDANYPANIVGMGSDDKTDDF